MDTNTASATQVTATQLQSETLRESVFKAMQRYFSQLDGSSDPKDLYEMVNNEVEGPMLEALILFTKNNQSRAARILGISRGTLRKKLKQYGLL